MNRVTVEHIQGIFSPEHGGPTVSLSKYAVGQAASGLGVRVRVLEGFAGKSAALRLPEPVDQRVFTVHQPKVAGRTRELRSFLMRENSPNIYHLHGSWLLAMKYGAEEAWQRKVPYVVEPMGSYQPEELRRKPIRKWLFRRWFQDEIFRRASCIQTNSKVEAEQFVRLGFRGPFMAIPVGFDLQRAAELENQLAGYTPAITDSLPVKNTRIILFLGRVHPNKGAGILVDAWCSLAREFSDACLVLAGPGENAYVKKLAAVARRSGAGGQIHFLGYVSDRDRTWLYRNSWAYCLPSFSENYGATIQDALGFGLPVMTTRRTPWLEMETRGAGWLVSPEVNAVAAGLRGALCSSAEEVKDMGSRGRAWINREYSLAASIAKQVSMYDWLLGGTMPAEVFYA